MKRCIKCSNSNRVHSCLACIRSTIKYTKNASESQYTQLYKQVYKVMQINQMAVLVGIRESKSFLAIIEQEVLEESWITEISQSRGSKSSITSKIAHQLFAPVNWSTVCNGLMVTNKRRR